ncbi:MAG: hypothetical protein O8C65_01160 [Candidatus Methanoperedens sp.]|nr:hypothetical protein [Candidatus Methanoperedens sp.]
MNPKLFLKISIPVSFGISVIALLLPRNIAGIYTINIMLISLLIAFLLSLKVAFSYERELKKVFFYLAFFILFLFFANLDQFWSLLYSIFGPLPYISLAVAGIAYVLLIRSCINILKITDFTSIHKKEWIFIIFMFILGNFIIFYFLLNYRIEFNVEVLTKILFRIIDNAIVIMLLPILFLYRQQSSMENKESITFTIVLIGIIISTIGDYVLEILSKISYQELSSGFHTGTLLDSIYILSYLLIALGLYAHLNYYRWTMKKIDLDRLDLTI